MYNILVADDEMPERQVIRFLLNKYNFPLRVTEAANGNEALKLLEKKKYDILLTDIKMPFIDGLELAGQARKLYPDMHIIFFSGYDDFDYVKQALSLHVVNYILKPINPEEFSKTITNVLGQLKEREEQISRQQMSLNFVRNHVLYQIINKTNIDSLKLVYPHLDFSFAYSYHRLILFQLEKNFFGNGLSEEDTGFFPVDLKALLPEDCDFINLNPAQNLILFYGNKHHTEWYEKQAEKIAKYLERICHTSCSAAVSSPFTVPEEISAAYEAAEADLANHLFFAGELLSEDETTDNSADSLEDDVLLKHVEKAIQLKDAVHLRKSVSQLFFKYNNTGSQSQIYIRFLCTRLFKILLDNLSGDSGISFDEIAEQIYFFQQLSEIETIIWEVTDKVIEKLEKEQQSPKHAIHIVKQYIYNHYSEDLCLNLLAEQVYLSPSYLSAVFIQETGYGINKFIKNVRMEKAQELLLNTNKKITDICRQTGYSNVSYFCKSFVENFGTTPEKYRQQGKNPENAEETENEKTN